MREVCSAGGWPRARSLQCRWRDQLALDENAGYISSAEHFEAVRIRVVNQRVVLREHIARFPREKRGGCIM